MLFREGKRKEIFHNLFNNNIRYDVMSIITQILPFNNIVLLSIFCGQILKSLTK